MKREKTFSKKVRSTMNLKILYVCIIIIASCSNNRSQKYEGKEAIDTINGTPENKSNVAADSSVIYILSLDGEVLRQIKYIAEKYSENDQNKKPKYVNYIRGYPERDTILGDFDGDLIPEKAWFDNRGFEVFEECRATGSKKSCEGIVRFSNLTIKPLIIDYSPMWTFKNEGDLNFDGKDEIGVLPGWFSSGCRSYEVFTYKNNRWIESCPPIENSYNMREAGIIMIEKDSGTPGSALIRESLDSYISANPQNKIPSDYSQGSCCAWSNVVEYKIKLK